jgi:transcriptional regulator with PAS, ATPase and Fis domain
MVLCCLIHPTEERCKVPTEPECGCAGIELPSLLEGLTDPSAVVDLNHRIIAANQAYRNTFNHGKKVCGRHCFEVSHHLTVPCEEAGEKCPLASALRRGGRAQVLHVHHTNSGETYETVTARPLHGRDGSLVGVLEIHRPARIASASPRDGGLVGQSPAFRRMLDLAMRVASAPVTVLLLGESGTGKELVARSLHDMSLRSDEPFVPVDCSGLTESLFESELFGHEKGAFTGACGRKRGLVEASDRGTLFLDEVGDIPLSLQVKLLRLLETGVFRRVGSVEQRHSDFRLICATHRDLEQMVAEETFRSDLYYRMSAFPVHLPPLRERVEDIPLLVESLLERSGHERISRIHPATLATLQSYSFPGNVRELQNVLQRASLLCEGDTLLPSHLPSRFRQADGEIQDPPGERELLPLAEAELRYLGWAVSRFNGDKKQLAQRLGVSERTLYRKLRCLRRASGAAATACLEVPAETAAYAATPRWLPRRAS